MSWNPFKTKKKRVLDEVNATNVNICDLERAINALTKRIGKMEGEIKLIRAILIDRFKKGEMATAENNKWQDWARTNLREVIRYGVIIIITLIGAKAAGLI